MSNTKRPSLQRVQTPKDKAALQKQLDAGVALTWNGETYAVRLGDVTSEIERRYRRECGQSVQALLHQFASDPGLDSVADLVWVARMIRGEDVDIADIVIGFGDFADMEIAESGEETDPEA